jgi:hypothetical protein
MHAYVHASMRKFMHTHIQGHAHLILGAYGSAICFKGDVFQWIAGNATKSLDLLVQYWELLAQPNNSQSGDYGYSAEDMERFGTSVGQAVYRSLDAAAGRGIKMRLVESTCPDKRR